MSEASTSTSVLAQAEVIDLTGIDEEESESEESSESERSDDSIQLRIDSDSRSQLYLALSAVPEAQIREILKQLIEQVPAVEYALTRELVSRKRKFREPRIELCGKCQEEFDVDAERAENECCFHPGSLKPDYESFPDWDEDVHGTIDSEETRREYPDSFFWSCCRANSFGEGCVLGAHQSAQSGPRKRLREDV